MNDAAEGVLAATAGEGWHGELTLAYERSGNRSILTRRAHRGPLVRMLRLPLRS